MKRPVRAASCVFVLLLASAVNAEPSTLPAPDPASLRGESVQTRKRLAEAEQKLLAGKPADAADDLQRIMDECPDDLITLDLTTADGQQFQTARWVAHSLLAKLPPEALKAYQDRIDQPAKKLLEQAKRDRNPRPLWQLLDWYFVSRPADEALLLLGDLLFERGEFRTAETVWRRLLPNANGDIVYPNSKADPALVRARIALAVIFQNDPARAKAEVAAFKEKYPTATGTLAGKTGPLANVLQTFLDTPPKLPPDATSGTIWPTYGGGPQRTSRVACGIPPWPSRPTPPIRDIIRPAAPAPARPPLGYPAIINDEVFVASGTRVYGFDLRTSEATRDEYTTFLKLEPNAAKPLEAQCTLTAAGELLYARLGPSVIRAPELARADSVLVCLSLRTPGKFTELWKLLPPEDGKAATTWEGAPLVSGRRLWAVYAKFEGGHIIHIAVCYDPADADKPPGPPIWTAELCDSPQPAAGHERTRQELLTLAGRNLVFCSNNGAIVAINATTGRRAWGFRYPRSRKVNVSGDPAPAVAYGGCVYVAPADGEHVYALDAETGRLIWKSGQTEGAQILGIARNRLIITVTGPLRSIRGLNLETGSHYKDEGGWVQQNGTGILSYGHGFVTDDVIVWPSRKGLFFLRPEDGRPTGGAPNPFRGPSGEMCFGHVVYANGTLVVVTPTQLWFYRAQSRKIETRPDTPPRERFDTMIDLAERALAAGHSDRANAILAEVAASDLPPEFRAWAAARMLQLAPPAKNLNQLPPKVREVLSPTLLNEWILPPDGVPVTLDTFLQKRLARPPTPASVPAVATCKTLASELTADAEIDRTLKLPESVVPLRPIVGSGPPKRLFAAGPRVVIAVPLDRSAETEHTAADLFTHAADLRTCFVTAGPFAIAVYGMAREPLWVFRVPRTEPLPSGSPIYRVCSDGELPCPHLSSFVLAGTWMLARIGEHHLIAIDLQARRVVWVLGTSGNARYEPNHFPGEVKFGAQYALCGHFVVVQLSDGRRWFVTLNTGRPTTMPALGDRTARNGWPHPPTLAGDNQLVVADGPGLVRLIQLGGRVKWAFEPESDEGFTGEPAQVRACGPGLLRREPSPQIPPRPPLLLIAVRRNHGVEIERVNMTDGKSAWTNGPAFVDADRIDIRAADVDAERAYIPAGNKLFALALTSGKTAWEVNLPDAHSARGWVVRAGKTCIIAYPAEAIPTEPMVAVWARLGRSFQREPYAWRLPGLAGTLYDAWSDRAVPVLFLDPDTGKRLARINIPARGPAITAWFDADTAVIATGDRVVWLK